MTLVRVGGCSLIKCRASRRISLSSMFYLHSPEMNCLAPWNPTVSPSQKIPTITVIIPINLNMMSPMLFLPGVSFLILVNLNSAAVPFLQGSGVRVANFYCPSHCYDDQDIKRRCAAGNSRRRLQKAACPQ